MKRFLPLVLVLGLFSTIFITSCSEKDPVIVLDDITKANDTMPGKYDDLLTYTPNDTNNTGSNLGDIEITVRRMSEAGPKLSDVLVELYLTQDDMDNKTNRQLFDVTNTQGQVLFEDLILNEDYFAHALHTEDKDTFVGEVRVVVKISNAGGNVNSAPLIVNPK